MTSPSDDAITDPETTRVLCQETTMKPLCWLTLGLALATAAVPTAATSAEPSASSRLGYGPAYETLARLAVLHEGRIKPLDTLAREEVRQIFGRESVKLVDPARENGVAETWSATAALFDWSVRPEFWDDQPIILVEYLPLKRMILADSIRSRLNALAEKSTTAPADRAAIKALAADQELSANSIRAALDRGKFAGDDRTTLAVLAAELAEDHKWLTPRQIEEARMTSGDQGVPFMAWFQEVVQKKRQADSGAGGAVRLTEVEKRGSDVGTRLIHYQAIRDRSMRSVEPMQIMPRPNNKAYLAFLAKTYEKARKSANSDDLAPLELDGAKALDTYWNELAMDERSVPGTDEAFDAKFSSWLRTSSAWVPLKAILDTKPEALAEAGYPAEQMNAFLKAFKDLGDAEDGKPGTVGEAHTRALVDAARALGEAVNPTGYPAVEAIQRETYFNESSPFWKAQWAYMLATVLLGACVGFMGFERRSALGGFGRLLYAAGMLGLLGGIALEVQGFYYRVRISGWAPVTNMYETVIWVSLVSAVLGLVFEGVFRKVYAALSASAVALLGTVLAANVPLLDPNIHQLQPVLRSNYWLTIHVLTEVSSYGAFMMAAFLGLIACGYYLTATYRRSPRISELLLPLVPGLPLFGVGAFGVAGSQGSFGPGWVTGDAVFYVMCLLAGVGGMLLITAGVALAGELASRATFREGSAVAMDEIAGRTKPAILHPTAAEIRAMSAGQKVDLDARGLAMQATAAKIKPLSNFIYRTMQVGVLLIAAGTILGGVWADYSWGRFWGWDPKEVWALITLLVYLIPLHGRFAGWINTFTLVFASVLCSLSVVMAWYGVNFVLGVGLHSYGFTEGGGQGVVMAVCAAVLSIPLAAGWRRRLGSLDVAEVTA
jgi:ABC-type transport system involved in cytochrome c biogenesis permease subunit